MRPILGILVIPGAAFATGCFSARPSAPDSFVCQAFRNAVEAPIRDTDECHFLKRTRKQAEQAWEQFRDGCTFRLSDPFHDGFVEGFVDYVHAGGSGEPPYLPPFRYRLTSSHTPDGVARIEDWYAGWRQGAAVAKASGLRELTYVPLPAYAAIKDLNAPDVVEASNLPPPKLNPGESSPWERPGSLPMPRPIPTPTPAPEPMPEPRFPGPIGNPVMPRTQVEPAVPPAASTGATASTWPVPSGAALPAIPIALGPPATPAASAPSARPSGETDPWRPAAPGSPVPGAGSP